MNSDQWLDFRTERRLEREMRERERQLKKHQEKLEKRDFFSELNERARDGPEDSSGFPNIRPDASKRGRT